MVDSWFTEPALAAVPGRVVSLGLPLLERGVPVVFLRAPEEGPMVRRPDIIGAFRFVALSRLRALQLAQGCTPRVAGTHTVAVMAQMEVAAGEVKACEDAVDGVTPS